MTSAAQVEWPGAHTGGAAFTFDVDAESAVLWGSPATASRMGVMSHQAYGPLVGVPRLLRILERRRVRATFFVPGYTALRYPQVVRDIAAAGHEIGHHGYLHEKPSGLSIDQERVALDRGLAALEKVAHVRPIGYRAPMWDLSWQTPALLAERGFLYDSSLMDADVPYELAVEPGSTTSVVEVPLQWALDDWEQYCFLPDVSGSGLIETPAKARELWQGEYEAMMAEGGCWVLTNHPFLSGRPARARELDALIGDVVDDPASWVASLGEIAQHVRSLGLRPRSIERPLLDH